MLFSVSLSTVFFGALANQCANDAGGTGTCENPDLRHSRATNSDCFALDKDCLDQMNGAERSDHVPFDTVMAKVEEVGRESLHAGSIGREEWMRRFSDNYCTTLQSEKFPKTSKDVAALQEKLADSANRGFSTMLVHVDDKEDGIGARAKKLLELIAAGLRLGFSRVAATLPPHSGLLHPADWPPGPTWCHESPAEGPEEQSSHSPEYPLICWRFDFQADLMGQSAAPEQRVLLWGAPQNQSVLSAASGEPASRFDCFSFVDIEDSAVWDYHQQQGPQPPEISERFFGSVREFSAVRSVLPGRREVLCGYGRPEPPGGEDAGGAVHVAIHVRRGDVGERSRYSLTEQLGAKDFSAWLCGLAATLGLAEGQFLLLHVFTEIAGQTRAAWRRAARRGAFPGLTFGKQADDDAGPTNHVWAKLEAEPTCGNVNRKVHVIVNNNPRQALLCMARADVLVTSFSSLGWVSAVLNGGIVFHPDAGESRDHRKTHWDLRDQYLDLAENWFRASDVWHRREKVQAIWRQNSAA